MTSSSNNNQSDTTLGPPWTVLKLLKWTQSYFEKHGIDSPRLEAEILLAAVLKLERLQLYLRFDQPVLESELKQYREFVKRRSTGEPVAYILGKKAFYTIEVSCDRRALIPRSDTEVLIEVVLERLPEETKTVIDVGTGTGIVGLTIATEIPDVNVILTDISVDALDLAKINRNDLGLDKRVGLLSGNLLDPIPPHRTFEVVVSNPPYISDSTREFVSKEVDQFEPHNALYAGKDGLDIIRPLTQSAFQRLPNGGLFATEIGFDQGEIVVQLFENTGFQEVELRHDYSGNPRVVSGIKIDPTTE